ncbi:hypothetical protein B0T20DRAFT_391995 [Sordaria brevicollis]|uniref:Uncharacterized protein n=1 Tax=Sordaria brevicollis TaxID=83679 RepID=A0AAE0PFL6_SORBR|nr:hypothetical protein B0T20DRAFT_391995 [Sordaria brevicollis]
MRKTRTDLLSLKFEERRPTFCRMGPLSAVNGGSVEETSHPGSSHIHAAPAVSIDRISTARRHGRCAHDLVASAYLLTGDHAYHCRRVGLCSWTSDMMPALGPDDITHRPCSITTNPTTPRTCRQLLPSSQPVFSFSSPSVTASVWVPIGDSLGVTRPSYSTRPTAESRLFCCCTCGPPPRKPHQPLPLNDNGTAALKSGSGSMRYGYPLRSCAVSSFGLVRSSFRSWARTALEYLAQAGPPMLCDLIPCGKSFLSVVHSTTRRVVLLLKAVAQRKHG